MTLETHHNSIAHRLVTLYLLALFSVFPLYLTGERLQGISFKLLLYGFFTLSVAAVYIVLLLRGKVSRRKHLYRIDTGMLILLLLSLLHMAGQVWKGSGNYELSALAGISVIAYFVLSSSEDGGRLLFKLSFLDLFLAADMLIYLVLLLRVLAFPDLREPVGLLAEEGGALNAFLVLSVGVNMLQYCGNRRKVKDGVYLLTAAAGSFLLFLQKDTAGILLMGALFLGIPLLFLPTAELMKRNFTAAFLFFFLLSNMPLITEYTGLIQMDVHFDMKSSVYLDLFLAVAGVLVLSYWERLPKNAPPGAVVMKRLQKAFMFAFKLYGILLAAVWSVGGERMRTAIGTDGTFAQVFETYGIIGMVALSAVFALMIAGVRRQYRQSAESAILTAAAVLFMAQSFFYRQQAVTTPVYAALVTFALFQEGKKEEKDEKKLRKNKEVEKAVSSGGVACRALGEHGVGKPDGAAGGDDGSGSGGGSGQRVCAGDGSHKGV